ncbi:DciA family protein [Amycolatopsis sp. KNN50.9b]|uniref:DciA family protein n=1 Tax=Amycolatopsis sp. KNN50.9b TaxID=2018303 RepID=UPI001E397AA4|nr:DciA family protein [Amycolatopsis sp. KNN50.9b]
MITFRFVHHRRRANEASGHSKVSDEGHMGADGVAGGSLNPWDGTRVHLGQREGGRAAAAPELAGHVQAMGFDADTGRLGVAPDAPAYGTQLRWKAPKLIAAANERVSGANVRSIHVLAPATAKAGPATAAAEPDPQPAASTGPVRTRETASDGYHRALAAHRKAAHYAWRTRASLRPWTGRPGRCARSASVRFLSRPRMANRAARIQRRREADATHAVALRRARAGRAQRADGPADAQQAPTARRMA